MKKNKADIILIGILILAGVMFALIFVLSEKGDYVEVTVDSEPEGTFPLSENTEIEIRGIDGGTDVLVIENGQAYIKEASCPDKLCIKMGKIKRNGQSIICLPNRVTVTVHSKKNISDIDGISGGVHEK